MVPRETLPDNLADLLPTSAKKLLARSGPNLIRNLGIEVIRGIVYDVLTGKNLRDSTELLTRRRIAGLNLGLVKMFLNGTLASADFVEELPRLASDMLQRTGLKKSERWLGQWILGLTDKAFQNVLRDDPKALAAYARRYAEVCREVVEERRKEDGSLSGILQLESGDKAKVDWLFCAYLLNAVGAETLAIRGSEKSAYGKLFEKLVLGSLLYILGFKHISRDKPTKLRNVFWLSSRGERRESDATVLLGAGKGVRFDIGFIGRGKTRRCLWTR